jgi:hypothetical protein
MVAFVKMKKMMRGGARDAHGAQIIGQNSLFMDD